MKNKKFELFWKTYQEADSEKSKLEMMREFMLNSSFEELIAWNDFLSEMSHNSLQKIISQGLTNEDREFFKEQYAKFDALEDQIKVRKAA